jgi:hypothetical protein
MACPWCYCETRSPIPSRQYESHCAVSGHRLFENVAVVIRIGPSHAGNAAESRMGWILPVWQKTGWAGVHILYSNMQLLLTC